MSRPVDRDIKAKASINRFRTIHKLDKANKIVYCAMFFDKLRRVLSYNQTGA
ncbi:hypothetical protein C4J91_2436 [Pseudomonas sp. R3-52-08]|nr:hypothetical protein C4J91_2436 [Pseudomonas sp. R3-52-08]